MLRLDVERIADVPAVFRFFHPNIYDILRRVSSSSDCMEPSIAIRICAVELGRS